MEELFPLLKYFGDKTILSHFIEQCVVYLDNVSLHLSARMLDELLSIFLLHSGTHPAILYNV
jgi:hypothetical protein